VILKVAAVCACVKEAAAGERFIVGKYGAVNSFHGPNRSVFKVPNAENTAKVAGFHTAYARSMSCCVDLLSARGPRNREGGKTVRIWAEGERGACCQVRHTGGRDVEEISIEALERILGAGKYVITATSAIGFSPSRV
jgi:hypothetical protein